MTFAAFTASCRAISAARRRRRCSSAFCSAQTWTFAACAFSVWTSPSRSATSLRNCVCLPDATRTPQIQPMTQPAANEISATQRRVVNIYTSAPAAKTGLSTTLGAFEQDYQPAGATFARRGRSSRRLSQTGILPLRNKDTQTNTLRWLFFNDVFRP